MAFTSTYKLVNGIAQLTLTGGLDATAAPAFRADIEKAAADKAKNMVLFMKDLEFLASAGLRLLIFARQTLGAQANIYLIGVQEEVKDTLTMTGFQNLITFLDEYDAAQIE